MYCGFQANPLLVKLQSPCPILTHPDEMCSGLSRLKNLGLGLQSEIESQDDSIDALLNKADKMDARIHNTNQQMKKLK